MAIIDKIKVGLTTYNIAGGSGNINYHWQYEEGTIYAKSLWNWNTKTMDSSGNQYTCVKFVFDNDTKTKVRISASTSGSSNRLGYCFVDENDNPVLKPDFTSGEEFVDFEIDVPADAYALYLNGNNYISPHLEVALYDIRGDFHTLDKLLKQYAHKISYRDTFAWKPMPTGLVAFTFDDSLDDIGDIVDVFLAKHVPCCFGAIPEKLNMSLASGETVAEAMHRMCDSAYGGEVLAHGASGREIVTVDNIDDLNFLYNKFVVNRTKLEDFGFKVRGTVRVGGTGNIVQDPRTDVWCRLVFDYGDAYGVSEPYWHPRFSGATLQDYYDEIDDAILDKRFTALLFHGADLEDLPNMIDYVLEQGGQIVTYATAYDTYGSTVEEVSILNRLSTLEGLDANSEEY